MNISISRVITLSAVMTFASVALMQGAEQGTFHLPVTAHWGQAVLAPGDYEVSLPEPATGEMEFLVKGNGKTVYELPLVGSTQNTSVFSSLDIREIDGTYFVREFSSGPSGETFIFPMPKASRHQQFAKGGLSLAVARK